VHDREGVALDADVWHEHVAIDTRAELLYRLGGALEIEGDAVLH